MVFKDKEQGSRKLPKPLKITKLMNIFKKPGYQNSFELLKTARRAREYGRQVSSSPSTVTNTRQQRNNEGTWEATSCCKWTSSQDSTKPHHQKTPPSLSGVGSWKMCLHECSLRQGMHNAAWRDSEHLQTRSCMVYWEERHLKPKGISLWFIHTATSFYSMRNI